MIKGLGLIGEIMLCTSPLYRIFPRDLWPRDRTYLKPEILFSRHAWHCSVMLTRLVVCSPLLIQELLLSSSSCLKHILMDVMQQSFTHSMCEEMGLSKGPWFPSGSWKCENAACRLWSWLPVSFSFRMSSGFLSHLNEEQTTIVCQACCFYTSSQWIFLGAARVDDGSVSGSLCLGHAWIVVQPAGLSGWYLCLLTFQPGPPCH